MGTRGSLLALTQSGLVKDAVEALGHSVDVVTVQTSGDRDQAHSLSSIGGVGVFTRELDAALLDGRVDFVVHSLKDLPTQLDPRVALAAVPEREDPRDVLIGPAGAGAPTLATLPEKARVGTSSLRRRALARAFRPDLRIQAIRGNLDTRIAKVDRGDVDAILVAAAGVRRLGLWDRVGEALERTAWLPAPGQGALAVVTRAGDDAARDVVSALDHPPSRAAVAAERALLAALGGGCQVPIGALGLPYDTGLRLWAVVASPDGRQVLRCDATGRLAEPERLGAEVARLLEGRGAAEILEAIPDEAVDPLSHP